MALLLQSANQYQLYPKYNVVPYITRNSNTSEKVVKITSPRKVLKLEVTDYQLFII